MMWEGNGAGEGQVVYGYEAEGAQEVLHMEEGTSNEVSGPI